MDFLAPSPPFGRKKRAIVTSGAVAAGGTLALVGLGAASLLYESRCSWNPLSRSYGRCRK